MTPTAETRHFPTENGGVIGPVSFSLGHSPSVILPRSFSLGHSPRVWESFPDVQWLVPYTSVSNSGAAERIEETASRGFKVKRNLDWWVAKGKKEDSTPEEQEAAAIVLIKRIANEAPNKHANLIPEAFARALNSKTGVAINATIFKTNVEHNTGASAKERLFKKHHFEGEVIPGQQYIIADDVSTTGATGYYLARYITAHGGIVVGNVQLGLTPRGERDTRTKRRAMVGDEQTLAMSDATRKALLKKADHATLNRAVENLGIAYDWRTLTDALARSLAANWKANFGRVPKGGADGAGGAGAGRPGSDGGGESLWAFPGEKENRGIGDDGKPVLEQGTFFSFSLAPYGIAKAGNRVLAHNPDARSQWDTAKTTVSDGKEVFGDSFPEGGKLKDILARVYEWGGKNGLFAEHRSLGKGQAFQKASL